MNIQTLFSHLRSTNWRPAPRAKTDIFAGHPKRYWSWMLMGTAFLFGIALVANISLFVLYSRSVQDAQSAGFGRAEITVDRSRLDGAIKILDARSAELNQRSAAPAQRDPSL